MRLMAFDKKLIEEDEGDFINYYAYEYSILMLLGDKYKFTKIDFSSDETTAYAMKRDYGGNLFDAKIATINTGRRVTLTFSDSFCVELNVNTTILQAFESCEEPEKVALKIGEYIDSCWLSKIKKS